MKFVVAMSAGLLASTLFFSGCSVPATGNLQPGKDVTGNWQFIPIDDFMHDDKLGALAGSLISQGNNVTGVLHGTGCVAATQDITFAGTVDAKGNLALTSTNLPENVATITGSVSITPGGMLIESSLTVSGTGACAMPPYLDFVGTEYPPLNGSFAASLTSSSGATATLMAQLTAATANSDGQIPETGTFTLAGASCSSTFSFTGVAVGSSLEGTFSSTSGSAVPTFSGQLSGGPPAANVSLVVPSGTCSAGSFTGTLLGK